MVSAHPSQHSRLLYSCVGRWKGSDLRFGFIAYDELVCVCVDEDIPRFGSLLLPENNGIGECVVFQDSGSRADTPRISMLSQENGNISYFLVFSTFSHEGFREQIDAM